MLEIILGLEDVLPLLPKAFVTGGVGPLFNGLVMER